jgi:hypothetical protein
VRAIGSTFAAETLGATSEPPWSRSGPPTYVQSGGQALRLLSRHLWAEGRRTLLLPGFLCESMIAPFLDREWRISYYDVDEDLQPNLASAVIAPEHLAHTVVVAAAYFGRRLSTRSVRALDVLSTGGACVVEDRTHNVLDWSGPNWDFAVASLRKLLPVGDGAVVVGGAWDIPRGGAGPGEGYWRAMDLKAGGDESAVSEWRRLFAEAEARFEVELEPAGASLRTVHAIERFPYARMAEARRSNAKQLVESLVDFDVVNADLDGGTPSHVVVRVEHPISVQRRLAASGVFCPIHWPRPAQVPYRLSWPDDVISLPIDHRYGEADMARVADVFKRTVLDD